MVPNTWRTRLSFNAKGLDFDSADIDPEAYKNVAPNCVWIDLANVSREAWPIDTHDFIVHSHVIEHISTTLAYPLYEIFRMQEKTGLQVACIPFMNGTYAEDFGPLTKEERISKFGQSDHVRRIGSQDVEYHPGKLVDLPLFDLTSSFTPEVLRGANIPEILWKGNHFSTVRVHRRSAWKLGNLD